MVVVGDGISDVRNLRLEPGLAALEKALADLAEFSCIARRAVLQDALAGLEHQVQPRELGVLRFEFVDDTQRLQVVLEAAVITHAGVQRVLTGMTERRVAEVVRQADRFGQRFAETEGACDRAAYLRYLQRVSQSRAIQVAFVIDEDLRLVHEAPERGRVNDAVPVPLIFTAVCGRRLLDAPAAALRFMCGVRCETLAHQAAVPTSSRSRRAS